MAMFSWLDLLFNLLGVLTSGIVLVAAVVALITLKNGGSVVLLVGSILGVLNSLGWLVLYFVQRAGAMDFNPTLFNTMRVLGATAWLLTALGVLLLAFSLGALRRHNKALESIVAGSQTDRVA